MRNVCCFGVVVLLAVLSACQSRSDAEKAQLIDNIAVTERYYSDVSKRIVDQALPAGGAIPVVVFDTTMTGEDLRTYLGLNLRAWCAWAVKLGAISVAEAKKILGENGLPTNLNDSGVVDGG